MTIYEEIQKMQNRLEDITTEFEAGESSTVTKEKLQELLDEAILWKIELEYDPVSSAILKKLIERIKNAQASVYHFSANNNNI